MHARLAPAALALIGALTVAGDLPRQALAGGSEPLLPGAPPGPHSPDSTVGGTAPPDSDSSPGLGPGSAAPWNPRGPLTGEARWETALRLPGRMVSLPLSGLGCLVRRQLLASEAANHVQRAQQVLVHGARYGIAAGAAGLGDGTGLGGSLKFSPPVLGRAFAAQGEASTRGYDRTRWTASAGPVSLQYTYEWRPTQRFYGIGLGTNPADASTYARQGEAVRLMLGWPWRRTRGPSPRARAIAWAGPRRSAQSGGREAPSFDVRFPEFASGQPRAPFEHLVYGARLEEDLRSGRPHWSRGARIALQAERFDRPLRALALRAAGAPPATWTSYALEGEAGASFMRDPRTVRLALRVVDNRRSGGRDLPLEALAHLGGSAGLSGFPAGRFHDLGSLVGRLTYVFPLAAYFELDVHAEAGGVYRDLWKDARLATLRNSCGVALRPRSASAALGTVGADWSTEGWSLRYSIGGAE